VGGVATLWDVLGGRVYIMSMLLSLFSFGTGNSGLTSCECFFLYISCLSASHREPTEGEQHLPGN